MKDKVSKKDNLMSVIPTAAKKASCGQISSPMTGYVSDIKFGELLKAAMRLVRITQSELSKKSGLRQSTISQLVNNKREPDYKSLCRIAKCFWLPASYWLGTET